jgi:hypothetical protein
MTRATIAGRRAGLILRWLLLLVIVGWLGLRLWALHVVRTAVPEFEAKHGSIDPGQWRRRPPADPSENAATWFEAAGNLLDRSGEGFQTFSASRDSALDGPPEPELARAIDVLRERQALPLALLAEGARRPTCVHYDATPRIGEPGKGRLTFLLNYLPLAQLDLALAAEESRRGDAAAGGRRFSEVFRLSECLLEEPVTNPVLVGSVLERLALRQVRTLLAEGHLDAELDRLADELDRRPRLDYRGVLRQEAYAFGPEGGWESFPPHEIPFELRWASPLAVDGFAGAVYLRTVDRALASLELDSPPAADPPRRPGLTERVLAKLHGGGEARLLREQWLTHRVFLAHLAMRDLARAAIRLRRRGVERGVYPAPDEVAALVATTTPLIDERILVRALPDGRIELSLPETEAVWNELAQLDDPVRDRSLRFTWTLPALSPDSSR